MIRKTDIVIIIAITDAQKENRNILFSSESFKSGFCLYNKEEKKKQTPESDNTITNRMNRYLESPKILRTELSDGSKNMEKPKITPSIPVKSQKSIHLFFI